MIDGAAQGWEECRGGTEGARWSLVQPVGPVLENSRPLLASLGGLLWQHMTEQSLTNWPMRAGRPRRHASEREGRRLPGRGRGRRRRLDVLRKSRGRGP